MITIALAALACSVPVMDERTELLRKAHAAAIESIARAEADASRPGFHFRAPGRWMNDPNGPIYYGGWYNLFYQFNPYGSQWGDMHWGHARSRDLVDWEHLPIALWPTKSKGEDHIFSGSTFLDGRGKPVIFYTSIGNRAPEQWIARPGDADLLEWFKPSVNPVVTEKHHGDTKIDEWRDPFLFSEAGKTYMIVGGRHEGRGSVALYRAENSELTKWRFEGVLFLHPKSNLIECPNIARVDNKWLLLTSHVGRVDWFLGTLDVANHMFKPEKSGVLASRSYASQLLRDKDGHLIHLGWIPTSDHKDWNGYLALPSVLKVNSAGEVTRQPLDALKNLRLDSNRFAGSKDLPEFCELELELRGEAKIRFCGHTISFDPVARELSIPNAEKLAVRGETVHLRLFRDRSALDVYADNGRASACLDAKDNALTVLSGSVEGMVYRLRTAKFDLSRFR